MTRHHSGRNRAGPTRMGRVGNILKRITFGLFVGIIAGLASVSDLRVTAGMKALASGLLMVALICYAISFFPLVGWLLKSMQRGFFPGLTKAKAEAMLWQNMAAAIVVAALVRTALAPP